MRPNSVFAKSEIGTIGLLLAVGTTLGYGLLTKGRASLDARYESFYHPRPPEVSDFRLVETGFSAQGPRFKRLSESTISRVDLSGCARWAKYAVKFDSSEARVRPASVHLRDDFGRKWPAISIWEGTNMYVFVPKGYSRPAKLEASLTIGSFVLGSSVFPALPKPSGQWQPPSTKPVISAKDWNGLSLRVDKDSIGDSSRLAINLNLPIAQNHVLLARLVGSSCTGCEKDTRTYLIKTHSKRESNQSIPMPLGLYYPQEAQYAYVQLIEMAPKPFKRRIVMPQCLTANADGHLEIDDSRNRLQLTPSILLFAYVGRRYGEPRSANFGDSRGPRLGISTSKMLGSAQVNLVSPTALNRVPIQLFNRIPTINDDPEQFVSEPKSSWDGNPTDLVFDLSGTTFEPIRTAIIRTELRSTELDRNN